MNDEYNNELDTETDEIDDLFAELDNGDISSDNGGSRDAITTAKNIGNTAVNELVNVDNLIDSVNDAVSQSLPSPVKREVNKLKEINNDILKPMGEAFKTARKSTSGIIKTINNVLPEIPGVSSTLNKIAEAIAPKEEEEEDYSGNYEESEDETVKNNVAEIFQENKAEDRAQEKIDAVSSLSELELSVRNLKNIEIMKEYFTVDHYKYIRKSLELQFKQVIALGDIRNRFGIYTEENKELLRAIIKNTGLPDMVKVERSELIEHKLKERAIGKGIDLIGNSNFVQNLKNVAQEKIIDKAIMYADSTDMFNDMVGGTAGQLDGMSAEDKAKLMAEMGAGQIRDMVIGKITNKLNKTELGSKVLGKVGSKLQKLTNDPAEFFRSFLPERLKQNGLVEGALDILDKANAQESVKSINLKNNENMDAPAVFDNTTHKAITNIIPNLLSKILNELKGIRTGKFNQNDELRFDFKDNKFKTQETIKQETIDDLNANSKAFQSKVKSSSETILNMLLGKNPSSEDIVLFKKGIEKIVLDGDPINIIQWYNDTSIFDNFDKKVRHKVFDGVKKLVLDENLDSMNKINRITSELEYVKHGTYFMSNNLQTLIDRGDTELIKDLNLTNENNSEISEENVKKLLMEGVKPSSEKEINNKKEATPKTSIHSDIPNNKIIDTNNNYSQSFGTVMTNINLDPLKEILISIKSNITNKLSQIKDINNKILDTLLNKNNSSNFESTNSISNNDARATLPNIRFHTGDNPTNFSLANPVIPARIPSISTSSLNRDTNNAVINVSNATVNIAEAVVSHALNNVAEIGQTVSNSLSSLADNVSSTLNRAVTATINTDLNQVFSQETLNNIKDTATGHLNTAKQTTLYKSASSIANTAIDNAKDTEAYKYLENKINDITDTKTFSTIATEINKIKDPKERKKLKKQLTTAKHKAEAGLAYVKENGVYNSTKKGLELLGETDVVKNAKTFKEGFEKDVEKNGLLNTVKSTAKSGIKNVTKNIKNSELYKEADKKLNDLKDTETYKAVNTKVNDIKNSEAYKTATSKVNTITDNIRNTIGEKLDSKTIEDNIKKKFKDNVVEVEEPNEKGELTKNLLIEIGDDIISIPVSSLDSVLKITNAVRNQVGIAKTPAIVSELLGDSKSIISSTTKKIEEFNKSDFGKKVHKNINTIKDSEIVKNTESKISSITNRINSVTKSALNENEVEQYIKEKYKDSIVEVDEKDKDGKVSKSLLLEIGETLLTIPVAALASPVVLAKVIKSQVGFLKTPSIMKELLPSATTIMSNIKNNVNKQIKDLKTTSKNKKENNSNLKETLEPSTVANNDLSILEKQKILNNKVNNSKDTINKIKPNTINNKTQNTADNIIKSTYEDNNSKIEDNDIEESNNSTSKIKEVKSTVKSFFSDIFGNKINLRKQLKKKYGKKIDFITIKNKQNKNEKIFMVPYKKQIIGIPEHSLKDIPTLLEDLEEQVKPVMASSVVKELINDNKVELDYSKASIDNFIKYVSSLENTNTNTKDIKLEELRVKNLKEQANHESTESENNEMELSTEENTENVKENFISKAIKNNKVTSIIFNKTKNILNRKYKNNDLENTISKLKNVDIKNTENIYNRIPDTIKPFITKDENGSYIVTLNDDIYKVDEEGLSKLLPVIQKKLEKGEIQIGNKSSISSFENIEDKFANAGVGGAVNEVAKDIKNNIIEKAKEHKGTTKSALRKTLSVMFNGKDPFKDKLNAADIGKAFTTGSFKGAYWFGRNVLRPGYKKMFSTVGSMAHEASKAILTKGFGFSPGVAEGVLGLVEAPFKLVSKAMGGVNTIFKKAKEAFQGFFNIVSKIGKFFLGGAWKLVKKGMGFLTGKSEEEINAKVQAGKDKIKNTGKNLHNKWMKAENSGLMTKLGMGAIRKTAGVASKLPMMPFKTTKALANTFIITDKEEDNLWLNRKMRDAKSLKNKITTKAKNKFSSTGNLLRTVGNAGLDLTSSIIPNSISGIDKTVDENGRTVVKIGDAEEFKKSANPINTVASKIKDTFNNKENKLDNNEEIEPDKIEEVKPHTETEHHIEVKPHMKKRHHKSILGHIASGIKNTFGITKTVGHLTRDIVKEHHTVPKPKTFLNKLVTKLKPKQNAITKREEHIEELRNSLEHKDKQSNKTEKKDSSSSFKLMSIIGLLGTAVTFIKKLFGGITSIGKHLFKWLPKIGDGIKLLKKHIVEAVAKSAHFIKDTVKAGYKKAKSFVKGADDAIKTEVPKSKSWFSNMVDDVKSTASNLKDKAFNIASKVKNGVVDVASKVKNGAIDLFKSAKDIVKHPWTSIKDAVSHLVDTPFVKKLATKVRTFLPKMKSIILDKLGPDVAEKALGKIGSMLVPGAGEAMMLWTAGQVAWDMLKDKMSFPSALSDAIIGVDLFKKDPAKVANTIKETKKITPKKITPIDNKKPEIHSTNKITHNEDIKLGAQTAKQTNKNLNKITSDTVPNNSPIINTTKIDNHKHTMQPVITKESSVATNLKVHNTHTPTPIIIKNKIDGKYTKTIAAHNNKIAATTEKQLNVQKEINDNLKTLTDIMVSMFDKKYKHGTKASTPTKRIHKTPVPAPKPAVSSYSSDF